MRTEINVCTRHQAVKQIQSAEKNEILYNQERERNEDDNLKETNQKEKNNSVRGMMTIYDANTLHRARTIFPGIFKRSGYGDSLNICYCVLA
jgi:hypothetical protein